MPDADYTKSGNDDNAIVMSREALKVNPNFEAAKASLGESYSHKYTLTKEPAFDPTSQKKKCHFEFHSAIPPPQAHTLPFF